MHSPGVTGRLAVIISTTSALSPTALSVPTTSSSRFVSRGVKSDPQSCYLVAALPAGTGLLANLWKMEVAGTWVAPSKEPVVLEPIVVMSVMLEPIVVVPVAPEPAAVEPACSEQLSSVWPSQREVGIVGIQVVPWVERTPEDACPKWRNLEG